MRHLSFIFLLAIAQCAWAQEGLESDDTDDGLPQYGENGMSYYIRTDENGEKYAATAFAGELKGDFVIPAYITKDKVPVKVIGPSWEHPSLDELLSITIPETVEEIKSLEMCLLDNIAPKFQGFIVDEKNSYFEAREGAVYRKDGTLIAWTPGLKSGRFVIPEGTTGVEHGVAFLLESANILVLPSTLEHYDYYLPHIINGEVAVICYATTPPQLLKSENELIYQGTIAYVPKGCIEAYASHEEWGKCQEIKEITDDIITGIQLRKDSPITRETIYSLDGRKIDGLQKGVNILKGTDGRVRKVSCNPATW